MGRTRPNLPIIIYNRQCVYIVRFLSKSETDREDKNKKLFCYAAIKMFPKLCYYQSIIIIIIKQRDIRKTEASEKYVLQK